MHARGEVTNVMDDPFSFVQSHPFVVEIFYLQAYRIHRLRSFMIFENYLDLKFSDFNLWFKYLNLSIISSLGYKFLVEKGEAKSFSNVLGLKPSSRPVTGLPICEKVLGNIFSCLLFVI